MRAALVLREGTLGRKHVILPFSSRWMEPVVTAAILFLREARSREIGREIGARSTRGACPREGRLCV